MGESVIGFGTGSDAAAASGFGAWIISVRVGTAVTRGTSGVFLVVAIPTRAPITKKPAASLPNSLR